MDKGFSGEYAIKSALNSLGFRVKPHNTSDKGLDVEATNGYKSICCEVLCWYGGFIHRNRFGSLIRNLVIGKFDERILVAFGTKCTTIQKRLLNMYNIKLLELPRIEHISMHGVITLISKLLGMYSVKYKKRVSRFPVYVEWKYIVEEELSKWVLFLNFWCKVKGDSACEKLNS